MERGAIRGRRKYSSFLILFLVIFGRLDYFWTPLAAAFGSKTSYGSYVGRVVELNEDGVTLDPVEGVTILVLDENSRTVFTAETDDEGTFSIPVTDPLVPGTVAPGEYQVLIQKVGYVSQLLTEQEFRARGFTTFEGANIIPSDDGGPASAVLGRPGPYALAGTIRDFDSDVAIAGARVYIREQFDESFSNDEGVYSFDQVTGDELHVEVSADGYISISILFRSNDDIAQTQDFYLQAETHVQGDVNGDGAVNATDVQIVINTALGLLPGLSADLNDDIIVDALDIQIVSLLAIGLTLPT
jgi:hypothetical protein